MANITEDFNAILSKSGAHTRRHPRKRSAVQDDFLKEAYQINEHISSLHDYLLSVRRPYLSTAPPSRRPHHRINPPKPQSFIPQNGSDLYLTTDDKSSIDASSKQLLRDLSASLTQLSSAESVRRETASRRLHTKYDKGILGRWAAGASGQTNKSPEQLLDEGHAETLKLFRESVLWYLGRRLEAAGEVQRDMMERRLEREMEKGRSVLYKVRGEAGLLGQASEEDRNESEVSRQHTSGKSTKASKAVDLEEETRRQVEQQLNPEQLQLFAQENQDMLKRYEDTLDQVRTAEKSMLEISELQTQLVQNLDIQSANISQMVADSSSTSENVGGGNKQLKRATERRSTARLVFYASCGLCGFLITWDLIF